MNNTNDRRDSRFFTGDEKELSELKKKQSFQRFMRRNRTKKRFARFLYTLLFAAIVIIFLIICLNFFFRVEKIEVVGTARYSADEIISLSDISPGVSIFSVSGKDLAGVTEKLAYIKNLRVVRKFPDTVVITVTEDEPWYYTELYGEYFILSDEFRVLERVAQKPDGGEYKLIELLLPQVDTVLVGNEVTFSADVSYKYVSAYVGALESSPMYEYATAFDLRDRFNLALIAKEIYLVNLGNGDEIATKFAAVAGMLKHAALSDGIPARIDATDPSQCPVIKNVDLKVEFAD